MLKHELLESNKKLSNLESSFWYKNNDSTLKELKNSLAYQALSDKKQRLISDIIWNEWADKESLKLLMGKTKEELEIIKRDKSFILDIIKKENIWITDLMDLREIMTKNYEKFIFDLDGTLLIPDRSCEDDYLKKNIAKEEQEKFFKEKQNILDTYEVNFPKYDTKTLSDYFKKYWFNVSEEIIEWWMNHNWENIKDKVADWVIELFKYLKENGKKIIILTNWFSKTQIPRLERSWLIQYIDEIVAWDKAMKPNIKSFELAVGETDKRDCLMIGDSLTSDKAGAKNANIDCCIIGKWYSIRNLFDIIKKS